MKIFFYGRNCVRFPDSDLEWWLQASVKYGHDWMVNHVFADSIKARYDISIPPEKQYDCISEADVADGSVMISVGGDGTFLEAVRTMHGRPMPIAGINLGRLGFLAHISPADIRSAISDICARRFTTGRRTMLTVEGDFGKQSPEFPCALNEFTIHRHTADMVEVAVYSGGELLTVIHGDGVIASTPTGSTAYSLSAGGPIVAPDCACFVYSAIAPHNFSIRPMVLPDTSVITFELRTRGREALASLDNTSFLVGDGAKFTIKKSEFSVFLMNIQNISFYDTLRDRTLWGVDRRDNF